MKLTDKARRAMETVLIRFRNGDLSPIVDIARIQLPDDAPSLKWTWRNRMLAYAQSGEVDNRGYDQWKLVGRQVKRGTRGVFIWVPFLYKTAGEEDPVLKGFGTASVHPYSHTKAVNGEESLSYEPREMPPLLGVAKALGTDVKWHPIADAYGNFSLRDEVISVGTEDVITFFHELAHAAHNKLTNLKGGQHSKQEVVAEFTACVLMHLYGFGDYSGNAWRYIKSYAGDPLDAVSRALVSIGKVLSLILETEEA